MIIRHLRFQQTFSSGLCDQSVHSLNSRNSEGDKDCSLSTTFEAEQSSESRVLEGFPLKWEQMASSALATASALPSHLRCGVSRSSSASSNGLGSSSKVSLFAHRPLQLVQKAGVKAESSGGRGAVVVRATSASSNGKAEKPTEYVPKADFYKVEAVLRPWRLTHVAAALIDSGIRGVTVTDVRGFGSQLGSRERQGGSEFSEDSLVAKVKMEVVVSKDQVEAVVDTIIQEARTGEIGDGKIFISPVTDIVRVRTGERGLKAERMIGGRADLLAKKVD